MMCGRSRPESSVWMWKTLPPYFTLLLKPTCARMKFGRAICFSSFAISSGVHCAMASSSARVVLRRDALHPLEGELRELRAGIEAERLGEELLALLVVRAVRGPGAEESDRFVALFLA